MDEHAADTLLKLAMKYLHGDGEKLEANPRHAYRNMDAIVGIFPNTDAGQEAAAILRSAQPADDPPQ